MTFSGRTTRWKHMHICLPTSVIRRSISTADAAAPSTEIVSVCNFARELLESRKMTMWILCTAFDEFWMRGAALGSNDARCLGQ